MPARPARRLSINHKLIGLNSILMTFVVTALTAYFPSRQIAEIRNGLVRRADIYGALLSKQLEPAVAFRDRETAREILSSLAMDPDVRSAVLCTADGIALDAVGVDGQSTCRGQAVTGARTIAVDDYRVVVVAPVISAEGPRGTLVIELSTAGLRRSRHQVTLMALGVGGFVLLVGVLASWLIARSLTRRLGRIVHVAAAVTAGSLEQEPIVDASLDEIGVLAGAFNAMLSQIRTLIANVQEMARRETSALAEANSMLERRVDERTIELSDTNGQLLREMQERNKVEVALRHAQKMEAVGRLAAGVAHEINTPIQFVSDSVHFVRDATNDLLSAAGTFETLCGRVLDGSARDAIEAAARQAQAASQLADVPYLLQNVPPALDRALDGLARVTAIVRSMKDFAHPDQKEMTPVDLNRAMENTLTICRNEYKLVAEVETHFGEIPLVVCHAGEVNQALLNILVNAAHAIADVVRGLEGKGRITVRSWRDDRDVVIAIGDTGNGIPEPIRDRIFDPFFTTKEVGRGTGQGLAISRSVIVDKHGGQLTFETTHGQGTTFFIRLPIERIVTKIAA
jgi:signal transduction histidine kinase